MSSQAMSRASPAEREPCGLPLPDSTSSFWHSQPSALLRGHRSTRQLPESADVVIIGSGITGTSVAHHILHEDTGNAKPDVVMLEAREVCWGATGRNGGHCHPLLFEHPEDPSIGRFELSNYNSIQGLIKEKNIECEWIAQPGCCALYSEDHLAAAELAMSTVSDNAPDLAPLMRLVTDKHELATLRVPTALGAVVSTNAAGLWPYKFVTRIVEDLVTSTDLRGSFNLQTLTPVTAISEADNGVEVSTSRGKIHAQKVILATNAYTSHLLPKFTDLIVPCRGQMSALKPFPSVADKSRLATSLVFLGTAMDDYLIQRANNVGGHLMFGGGRQCGPSMGVWDDNVVDEKTADYLRKQLITQLALPEGSDAVTQSTSKDRKDQMEAEYMWTGVMGFSRDERPWIGRVPGCGGAVYLAAGYTGHGMPNTWLCGKAVALMVKAVLNGVDYDEAAASAARAVGLPESYKLTQERITQAERLVDVAVKDWTELARDQKHHKPASGYA